MGRIVVSTVIEAPPNEVWAGVEDIAGHVDWMGDATAVRFVSEATSGVGTAFDCDTKVGPFSLTDRMVITEWVEGKTMGVGHVGLVKGEGRFTLSPVPGAGTEFTWDEELTFPWWMGGRIGGSIGGLILKRIWHKNLAALKDQIENG